MAGRPLRLTILGHPFEVSYRPSLSHIAGASDSTLGAVSTDDLDMQILEGQPASQERDTVLHEVIHAIIDQANLDSLFKRQKRDEPADTEPFVRPFATLLLDTLRRNPMLVAWLFEEDL